MNETPLPCTFRCGWEQTGPDAEAKRDRHEHLRHGQALPARELSGSGWQEQAVEAVRRVAARGRDFRIFDALAEFGLQSPPNHRAQIGRLSALVHDMGICHNIGGAPSTRPGTKRSQAAVWHRDPTRCTDVRCRTRAGAA